MDSSNKPSTSESASESLMKKVLEDIRGEDLMYDFGESLLSGVNSKGKGKGKAGGKKNDVNQHDAIAIRVIELLVPIMTAQFQKAFERSLEVMMKVLKESEEKKADLLQSQNLMLRYEIDRLEQYSRRESVRIVGLGGDTDEEDLQQKVLDIAQELDVNLKADDISVVHRTGKKLHRPNRPRDVIVKFTTRRAKSDIMKQKKKLKRNDGFKGVFLNDDLTPLRSKLLSICKAQKKVERVTTSHDGKIVCFLRKVPGSTSASPAPVFVETPDDLFQLGVDELDYERLGLTTLLHSSRHNK